MTTAAPAATRHSPPPADAAARPSVRPGALTQLLADLARAPDAAAGWEVPLLPGDVVGRFEIVREIGRGGFGVVYEARDRELSRSVAFKAVRASGADPLREARALGEAEAAARLAHPTIVHLYDVGRCEQGPYLIMELLRGETLDERLARGKLPLREAVRVAAEVSRGLAHAHAQGVVHRDLKPGNVFVCEDGQVKVLDFGLAHVFGRAGVAGGTPAYMAPEQERGEVGDERADVYSLGVMLHELVAGERLPPERVGVPTPPRGAPPALARLVGRMLSEDPAPRPSNGAEVYAALAAIQKSLEPRRLLWAAWGLAAAMAIAAVAFAAWPRHPLPPGRLVVAMADTANATGDADLDGAGRLLAAALEQSRRLSLVARSRLLALLRQSGDAAPSRIDERLAREAGRRAQANALIVPAVRRAGRGFDVELRAVDLSRDEPLFTVRERAGGKGELPDVLDRLSERVRKELREDPRDAPERRVALAQIAPANPEAWRHYTEAQQLDSAGDHAKAAEAYERALEVDPDFPLAHLALAERSTWYDDVTAQRHFEAAARHADRLPPKERTLLNATRASLAARTDEALEHWDRAIAGWPQDPAAYTAAGFTLLQFYPDAAAARPYLEKALELAALEHGDAIQALIAIDRMEEALERARRWTEIAPGPDSFGLLTRVHRVRGEPAAALEAARRVVSFDYLPGQDGFLADRRAPNSFWSFVEADALGEVEEMYRARGERSWELEALRGRLHAAIADLDRQARRRTSLDIDRSFAERSYYHNVRGNLVWGLGDANRVWAEVEEQLRLGSAAAMCSTQLLASLGDLDRAARLMGLWTNMADPRMYCPRLYRHVRDWKQGDREGAAQGLAGMYGPEPAYHLGVILGELGRDREAIDAFRRFRRDPAWNYDGANLVAYPRSLYFEAVSLERLGERGEAARALDRLLALWRSADAGLPYLREARALRVRLRPVPASP